MFRNRTEAGQKLASKLEAYFGQPDIVVLAMPRGGVPVGCEIAKALHVPVDVFVVRKLGVPWNPELAMGAVARVVFAFLMRRLSVLWLFHPKRLPRLPPPRKRKSSGANTPIAKAGFRFRLLARR